MVQKVWLVLQKLLHIEGYRALTALPTDSPARKGVSAGVAHLALDALPQLSFRGFERSQFIVDDHQLIKSLG